MNSYDTCFFFLLVTGRSDLRQDQEGFGKIPIMVMDATFVLIQLAGLGYFPSIAQFGGAQSVSALHKSIKVSHEHAFHTGHLHPQ